MICPLKSYRCRGCNLVEHLHRMCKNKGVERPIKRLGDTGGKSGSDEDVVNMFIAKGNQSCRGESVCKVSNEFKSAKV